MKGKKTDTESGLKIIATNRKARYNFTLGDKYEAGVQLVGSEVKSLRNGQVDFKDSYAVFKGDELFLQELHIAEYTFSNQFNHDPIRSRKLLLHRQELRSIKGKMQQKGFTLVPIRLYFKKGKVKIEIALAKGKRQYDKREDIKKRDMKRDIERENY
jgi:SsrA-binding protein